LEALGVVIESLEVGLPRPTVPAVHTLGADLVVRRQPVRSGT